MISLIRFLLGTGSHLSSLFTDPIHLTAARELKTLYDYVVHILPEQEIGYFSNGNGCLSTSNLHQNQQISPSTSVRFKYPIEAKDEATLKYFCFPDQHDSNNNQNINPFVSIKKPKSEYFRFTLTDMRGTRQHGYCSRFMHKGILNALCIISPCDMMELLPNRDDTIHIHTTTVGLYTLKCEYDRRKQLIDSVALLSLSTGKIDRL
jgi:hypothetical protein